MEIDVKRIAKLAMLKFSDEELSVLEKELSSIMTMVENLPEMDLNKSLLLNDKMELREDVVVPSLSREDVLFNVPRKMVGCVVVPKTVE